MPEPSLHEHLFDLALCVESARRVAEALDLGTPESLHSLTLEDISRVHGVASGIARLLSPAVSQLFDLAEHFLSLERSAS